jgi:hypothetical protein
MFSRFPDGINSCNLFMVDLSAVSLVQNIISGLLANNQLVIMREYAAVA